MAGNRVIRDKIPETFGRIPMPTVASGSLQEFPPASWKNLANEGDRFCPSGDFQASGAKHYAGPMLRATMKNAEAFATISCKCFA